MKAWQLIEKFESWTQHVFARKGGHENDMVPQAACISHNAVIAYLQED